MRKPNLLLGYSPKCRIYPKKSPTGAMSYYLYYYLMGPMRLVKSDITGDETIYSDNMGAVNDLQPLLCNYTASTGNTTATVFQYDSTTEEFTRVITTVPKVCGAIKTRNSEG